MAQGDVGIYASQISGRLWAPNGAYDALATINVSATTSSITFAGIPAGYKHLQIRLLARSDQFSEPGLRMRFNSDSGNNYAGHRLAGNGSVAYAQSFTSGNAIANYGPGGASSGTNVFGTNIIDILDYASTSKNKTVRILSGLEMNGSGTVAMYSGLWMNSSSPITSIYMETDNNWVANSQFALYGIK
jgi:hypothetical protein